jgi:hypothetical protein
VSFEFTAIASNDGISIKNRQGASLAHWDIGILLLGGFEGVTDLLSEQGWQQVTDWKPFRMGTSRCEVSPIPTSEENNRRIDIAVALSEEDEREGEQRPIRDRVESAMEFEAMIRDRGDRW